MVYNGLRDVMFFAGPCAGVAAAAMLFATVTFLVRYLLDQG